VIGGPDLSRDWAVPPTATERRPQTYRLSWWPVATVRRRALFRLVTGDDRAELEEIVTTVAIDEETTQTHRATDVDVDEIPDALLALLEADGVQPVRCDPA